MGGPAANVSVRLGRATKRSSFEFLGPNLVQNPLDHRKPPLEELELVLIGERW